LGVDVTALVGVDAGLLVVTSVVGVEPPPEELPSQVKSLGPGRKRKLVS
jgi:hypothetical protein